MQNEDRLYLEKLKRHADTVGVPVEWMDKSHARFPKYLKSEFALFSPTTGILDSHAFIMSLLGSIVEGDRADKQNDAGSLSSAGETGHLMLNTECLEIQYDQGRRRYTVQLATRTDVPRGPFRVKRSQNKNKNVSDTNNVERVTIDCKSVITCAGLWTDQLLGRVSSSAHFSEPDRYRIYPCKGYYYTFPNIAHYFNISKLKDKVKKQEPVVKELIYPVPPSPTSKERGGLGIHCTIDLQGRLRVGPDAQYLIESQYPFPKLTEENTNQLLSDYRRYQHRVDYRTPDPNSPEEHELREKFWKAMNNYLDLSESTPAGEQSFEKLRIDYAGIRAKLLPPPSLMSTNTASPTVRDFVIHDEKEEGFPGLITLAGIESPGLTAALAVGQYVVQEKLKPYL